MERTRADRLPTWSARLDITGLRAVAVLMVIGYHTGFPIFRGGFAGADIFFVVSGYAITRVLTPPADAPPLADFYRRRLRRLAPSLAVVVVVVSAVVILAFPRRLSHELGVESLATAVGAANWLYVVTARADGISPLRHLWSLGIECQFYLLWPLAVIATRRAAARRGTAWSPRLRGVAAVALVASLAAMTVIGPGNGPWRYFNTFDRVWELMAGAVAALVPRQDWLAGRPAAALSWAGLLAALAPVWLGWSDGTWPGPPTLVPVAGTALVLLVGDHAPGSGAIHVLSCGPLALVGGNSYALYLWHWPVLILAATWWGGLRAYEIVPLLLSIGILSWLTTRYVEVPIRSASRGRIATRGAGLASTLAVPLLMVLGSVLMLV